jgi:lipoprotein NlpI
MIEAVRAWQELSAMNRLASGFASGLAVAMLAAIGPALASGAADYRAGVLAADKGDYDGAIKLLGRALRQSLSAEQQEEAFYDRGVAYHRKGLYELAIADYSSALRLKPVDAKARANRGVAYKNERRFDLALADYDEAIKLDPDDASAHYNRANILVLQGQNDRAIADFNDAIRLQAGAGGHAATYFDETRFQPAAAGARPAANAPAAAAESRQYVLIWRYLAERRSGEDGRAELAAAAGRLESRSWPYPVIRFFLGKLGRDELLAAAADTGASSPDAHRCEAAAFLGEDDLLRGNTDSALHLFAQALDSCGENTAERVMVAAEQKRVALRQ